MGGGPQLSQEHTFVAINIVLSDTSNTTKADQLHKVAMSTRHSTVADRPQAGLLMTVAVETLPRKPALLLTSPASLHNPTLSIIVLVKHARFPAYDDTKHTMDTSINCQDPS